MIPHSLHIGKGIGKEIAVLLHKLGAQVIALSRTQEDLDGLTAAIPDVIAIKVDLENGTSFLVLWIALRCLLTLGAVNDTREAVAKAGDVDLLVYVSLRMQHHFFAYDKIYQLTFVAHVEITLVSLSVSHSWTLPWRHGIG